MLCTRPPNGNPITWNIPTIVDLPRVIVQHPGYDDHNTLLSLLSSDFTGSSLQGVHFRTVHTACCIIANNRFDGWLSHSRSRDDLTQRVSLTDHQILPSGTYFFHVPSLSPSPSPLPASGSSRREPPYPIVPNFQSWTFPHGSLPPSWTAAEMVQADPSPPPLAAHPRACAITNHTLTTRAAHLIPATEREWFAQQKMDRYVTSLDHEMELRDLLDAPENRIFLRSDVHQIWHEGKFSIVSQPLPSWHGAVATVKGAGQRKQRRQKEEEKERCRYAMTVTVTGAAQEMHGLYHGQRLRPLHGARVEFVFARFAWDVFALMRGFLMARRERWLAVWDDRTEKVVQGEFSAIECGIFALSQGRGCGTRGQKRRVGRKADRAGEGKRARRLSGSEADSKTGDADRVEIYDADEEEVEEEEEVDERDSWEEQERGLQSFHGGTNIGWS